MKVAMLAIAFWMVWGGETMAQGSADIMHRERGAETQDLLLKAFNEVLIAANTGDWASIHETVQELDGKVERYREAFGVDVRPKLQKSVSEKNPGVTLKHLAQVVYLGMREQFQAILDTRANDFLDSKARLEQAREYYMKVLSGNVKRKDAVRHERIEAKFLQAEAALGNPGVLLFLPETPSDLTMFDEAVKAIEMEVAAVYTYFNE